jgi:hypothetical protein
VVNLIKLLYAQKVFKDDLKTEGRMSAVITGAEAEHFIEKLALSAQNSIAGLHCKVYPIVNDSFGHMTNVKLFGAMTGIDI